jgi:hypothetical protein
MNSWVRLVFLWLSSVYIVSAASCNQDENKGKFEFYYYPKVNMYYDVADQHYLYSIDSAKTWMTLADTTTQEIATLGDKQVLYSDTRDIWRQNELHRQQFHGSILNIVPAENEADRVQDDVKERKQEVKAPVTKAPEKKKTAVGRFLQKIFGKKKDKPAK